MDITSITVRTLKKTGNLRGFANVTFDDQFVVTGIKIIKGSKGMFIGMPSTYSEEQDKYFDIYFPITAEFREELSDAVLEEYDKTLADKKGKGKGKKKKSRKEVEDDLDDDEDE